MQLIFDFNPGILSISVLRNTIRARGKQVQTSTEEGCPEEISQKVGMLVRNFSKTEQPAQYDPSEEYELKNVDQWHQRQLSNHHAEERSFCTCGYVERISPRYGHGARHWILLSTSLVEALLQTYLLARHGPLSIRYRGNAQMYAEGEQLLMGEVKRQGWVRPPGG